MEEEKERKHMKISHEWRQAGCMIHGKEIVSFTFYIWRYEQCEDMWSLPLYCETCVERGEIHQNKNQFLADDAGIQAYMNF
jgi:hypothetical protein